MSTFIPTASFQRCLALGHKVGIVVSLKLPSEARARSFHVVLNFADFTAGYIHATSVSDADKRFALNIWMQVRDEMRITDSFQELQSFSLLEQYVDKVIDNFEESIISGDPCATRFSELSYSYSSAMGTISYFWAQPSQLLCEFALPRV